MTTAVAGHFAFGENWRAFSEHIDEGRIALARDGLASLLGAETLRGKSFLDIGCGSGLHALAAIQLGAKSVHAIDVDPASVATTRSVLKHYAPGDSWTAEIRDVFDTGTLGEFDIVYSWGVLHHTGDVRRAIRCACDRVAHNGTLCIAIYARTPFCWFWKLEKRLYSRAVPSVQRAMRSVYVGLYWLRYAIAHGVRGSIFHPSDFRRTYAPRGMDFDTDVHDWMGGYPYESLTPQQVREILGSKGLAEVRANTLSIVGVFGSGCDEYVFKRIL